MKCPSVVPPHAKCPHCLAKASGSPCLRPRGQRAGSPQTAAERGGNRAALSVPRPASRSQGEGGGRLREQGQAQAAPSPGGGLGDPRVCGGRAGGGRALGPGVWPDAGLGPSVQAFLLPRGHQLGRGTGLDSGEGRRALPLALTKP